MNNLLLVFIVLLILKLSTSIVLDLLNLRYAQARASEVPESFRDFIAVSYTHLTLPTKA